jgi:hypothetical protein
LVKFGDKIDEVPLFVLPLEHHFLFDENEKFLSLVKKFIKNFNIENKD